MSDILERVKSSVAGTFNVPLDSITPATSSKNLKAWDSMGHLTLILALEQEFEVYFATEEIEGMAEVADIVSVLENRP